MYGAIFRTGSSVDTCSLFFFACLACLSPEGTLGLLLPESFFNISTFEYARLKALSLSINRLVDYDKAFKGLLTKAQAIILTNKPREQYNLIKCEKAGDSIQRSVDSFLSNPKAILNLHCDHESAATLDYLFSLPHIRLAEQASWGLGIVTGNNGKFVVSEAKEGYIAVFKGSDITQNELKRPSSYIPSDLSQYQQVAPLTLYQAKEKLIYKFISSRLCFFCDTEQRFLLRKRAKITVAFFASLRQAWNDDRPSNSQSQILRNQTSAQRASAPSRRPCRSQIPRARGHQISCRGLRAIPAEH